MFNLLAVSTQTIIDVVVIIFLAFTAIRGFTRGFVKTFFSLFGTIISLVLAFLLAAKVADFLQAQYSLVTTVSEKLSGTLTNMFGDVMNLTLAQATENAMSEAGLAGWLINVVLATQAEGSIPMDVTLNQIITPTFAYYVVMILSGIALFIIFKILFFLIGNLVKSLHKIKFIAVLDKVLGLAIGIISGMISIEFLISTLGILPIGFIQSLYSQIIACPVAGFIHKINVVGMISNWAASINVIGIIKDVISKIHV